MSRIAVVGGGAAGMMAACAAAETGHEVTLFEHNEKLGKKIYITGKGRCNLTNACEVEELFPAFSRNGKFLYSAVYQFDNRAVMDFFESRGLPLKVERGNRVFPRSDHSSDVIRVLSRAMETAGVKVKLRADVRELLTEENGYSEDTAGGHPRKGKAPERKRRVCGLVYDSTGKKEQKFFCDAVIMATGGLSYPSTGSDGSGFRILERLGHSLTQFRPSLVGMRTKEAYISELQGLALKNISFSVRSGKKLLYQEFGELLFTHQGISGPVVLTASSMIPDKYFQDGLTFEIDLKASLTEEKLDRRIQRDFTENQNRQYKNALGKLLPSKLIPAVIRLSGIDPEKKVNSITKEERQRLLHVLKHFPGTIVGLGDMREAVVTRGGIPVKEADPSTMESKLVRGLYLCGEMLDLDAVTGGFNLQIAWSTGHLAGISAGAEGL